MRSIEKFNALNGIVQKTELQNIIDLAKSEEQNHIVNKIQNVLCSFPTESEFNVLVKQREFPINRISQLNHIEYENNIEDDEIEGLGKPVSPEDIYNMITNKIIELLEKEINYEKMWQPNKSGYLYAYNYDTKKAYRSINALNLSSLYIYDPSQPLLENPYYLTFNQITKHKGKIKKGAEGFKVVYYTRLFSYKQAEPKLEFSTYDAKKMINWLKSKRSQISLLNNFSAEEITQQSIIPILKYYNVFNGRDIEGIDFDLDNFKLSGKIEGKEWPASEEIENAEAIIDNYPEKAPTLIIRGNDAYFRDSEDIVSMPNRNNFKNAQAYYTTLFHEYIHSTGSYKRLKREFGKKFGDKKYAFEELVAEIGASFLSAEAGILHYTLRNNVAYIKSWRKSLLKRLKKDNRFIFKASTKAQAAADYILQRDKEGKAKYLKKVIKVKVTNPKEGTQLALLGAKQKGLNFAISQYTPEVYTPSTVIEKQAQAHNEFEKGVFQGVPAAALSLPIPQPTIEQPKPKPVSAIDPVVSKMVKKAIDSKLPKGFTLASEKPDESELPGLFYLPGEIGKWLGKQQRYKLMFLVHGESGAGKSELVKQLTNAFINAGFRGGFFDIEQGGLRSKDTQESLDRNIPPENLDKIAFTSEAENGLQSVKDVANAFDFVVIDSWQKLKTPMTQLDDLRAEYPETIWIVIAQETTEGKAKGGSQASFDPPVRLKAYKADNTFVNNYTEIMKNRGNQQTVGTKYNMYSKTLVNESLPDLVSEPPQNRSFTIESY